MHSVETENGFRNEYRFLSNFFPAPIKWHGQIWPTLEHAFQACKATNAEDAEFVRLATTPAQAKRRGRQISIRTDWLDQRVHVMRDLLRLKFEQHPQLQKRLVRTSPTALVEYNPWGDCFWGKDIRTGEGLNVLGQLLMELRREFMKRKEEDLT